MFRNNEYDITSGVINFTDRTRIASALDVRADTQVREFLVHVTATGTPQQPRLVLTSEPALSEADIVTLLTLGVTSRDFDRAGGDSVTGFLLDAAANGRCGGSEIRISAADSAVSVFVIPSSEELAIAREALAVAERARD